MTTWVAPDTAFTGSTKYNNLTDMERRVCLAQGVPVAAGTNSYAVVRQNTSAAILYGVYPDAVYADIVANSGGGIGFSASEQAGAVTSAPTGDNSNSALPLIPYGFVARIVFCIGDSIVNGGVVSHRTKEKISAHFVRGGPAENHINDPNQRDSHFDAVNYWTANFGADSYQVANPNALGFGDWTTDFPKYLTNLAVASSQTMIFVLFMGTNDLSHEASINPITELYTNRLLPLIADIKAAYPSCKIVFVPPVVRGPTTTLNNRIIDYGQEVIDNLDSIDVDAVANSWLTDGAGVFTGLYPFDPQYPEMSCSCGHVDTIQSVDTATNIVTFNQPSSTNGMATGDAVALFTRDGTKPTGLDTANLWFVRKIADTGTTSTWTFHPTPADASGNTNIVDISSDVSGLVQVVENDRVLNSVTSNEIDLDDVGITILDGTPCIFLAATGGSVPAGVTANTVYYLKETTAVSGGTQGVKVFTNRSDAIAGTNEVAVTSVGTNARLFTIGDVHMSSDGVHPRHLGTQGVGTIIKTATDAL